VRSWGGLKLFVSLAKVKRCIKILNVPLFVVIDAQIKKICRGCSSPNRKQKLIVLRGILEGRSRERALMLQQGERTTFVYGAFSSFLWRTTSMKAGEGAPSDLLSSAAPFCR